MADIVQHLAGKTVALLAAEGTHEHEFWVPYYRFIEEGASVVVCGVEQGVVHRGEGRNGKDGLDLAPVDMATGDADAETFDALVVPGGIYGPLALRTHKPTLQLVRGMHERKRTIGAICHGQWVLVSAGVLQARDATCPSDMADDLMNAGAQFVDRDVVRDRNIVTAVYYGFLPQFMRVLVETIGA